MNLAAQRAKCLSEYERDVHLRTADAFSDLGFGHILEESKHQGGSLTLRQSSDQGDVPIQRRSPHPGLGSTSPRLSPSGRYSSSGPGGTSVERVE
jgi:hypothetical protein